MMIMLLVLLLATATVTCCAQETSSGPLVIPPSQFFEGNDGPWSTFDIRVGEPGQYIRALISTASPQTMVVLDSDGCSTSVFETVPPDCAKSRGGLFSVNKSTTWTGVGLHGINGDGVGLEANLGYTLRAEFGLEKLGLGLNGPSFDNQTVAGFATPEPFYLGVLGLNGQPVNFTTLGNFSSPSLLSTLKDQKKIPSLSWSYTAGAKYRLKQVYGQLIFSGYDTSRFEENSASFSMAGDVTRDLVVVLQSISYSGANSATLLSEPIDIYIDSTDPNLWLPGNVCDQFEKAFGLTLDEKSGLYLVNDSHHETLLDADAEVTFRISDVESGGEMVAIRLPYAAFDLMAENPLVNGSSRYFPLRRAANETQYTLGRTFLQEAYLSADYERKIFNVSACTWQEGAQSTIITIPSKDGNTGTGDPNNNNSGSGSDSHNLTPGAIAGITIGSIIAALLIALAIAFFVLRQRRKWIGAGFAKADSSKNKKDRRRDSVANGPVFNAGPGGPSRVGMVPGAMEETPWNADDVSGLSKSGSEARGDMTTVGGSNTTSTTTRSGVSGVPVSTGLGASDSNASSGNGRNAPVELGDTEIAERHSGGTGASSSLAPLVEDQPVMYELPGTEIARSKSGKLRMVENFSISGVPESSAAAGRSRFGDVSPISTRLVPKLDTSMGNEGDRRRVSDLVSPTTP